MAAGTRDIVSPWEGFHTQAEAFRELDDERVLVLTQMGGRAKTSGVELAQVRSNGAMLWHLSGGKVVRLVNYWDRDRALADLGMPPEGDSPPSENVDIVRRCFEAYRASGLDATRSFLHPDFELDQVPGTIFSGTYGTYEAARSITEFQSAFHDFGVEPREFIDRGDRVIAVIEEHGRPSGSDAALRQTMFGVFTLRDGKIARLQLFRDRPEAMRAAGDGAP
jgi:ketosteroid isomerase-like protein